MDIKTSLIDAKWLPEIQVLLVGRLESGFHGSERITSRSTKAIPERIVRCKSLIFSMHRVEIEPTTQ